nr:glutamate receptor-interacting protein 1-like [Parasteatoda tepidariorum]
MKLQYIVRRYTSEVELLKDEQCPLGISITGNHKERPTITNIKHGSVAQKSHCLSDGDVILSIREFDTKGMSKKDVKRYFKDSNPRLNMKVEYVTREACFGYCRIYSSQRMFLALRKVNGTFGFVLRKSSELLEYPVISSIKHGSPADREGILMDGDRLLEVDNQNLSWIPLAEAVSFLQNKDEVLLLIEYNVGIIGKVF